MKWHQRTARVSQSLHENELPTINEQRDWREIVYLPLHNYCRQIMAEEVEDRYVGLCTYSMLEIWWEIWQMDKPHCNPP